MFEVKFGIASALCFHFEYDISSKILPTIPSQNLPAMLYEILLRMPSEIYESFLQETNSLRIYSKVFQILPQELFKLFLYNAFLPKLLHEFLKSSINNFLRTSSRIASDFFLQSFFQNFVQRILKNFSKNSFYYHWTFPPQILSEIRTRVLLVNHPWISSEMLSVTSQGVKIQQLS